MNDFSFTLKRNYSDTPNLTNNFFYYSPFKSHNLSSTGNLKNIGYKTIRSPGFAEKFNNCSFSIHTSQRQPYYR